MIWPKLVTETDQDHLTLTLLLFFLLSDILILVNFSKVVLVGIKHSPKFLYDLIHWRYEVLFSANAL